MLLNQKQVDALTQHSEKAGISESCAMLLGTHNDQQWNVKEVFLTRNAHNESETSFIISPEELLQGHQLAEKKQLELVGIPSLSHALRCLVHCFGGVNGLQRPDLNLSPPVTVLIVLYW